VHANLFFAHVPFQTKPNPEGRGAGVVCMMHMCFASETWLAGKAHFFPISSNHIVLFVYENDLSGPLSTPFNWRPCSLVCDRLGSFDLPRFMLEYFEEVGCMWWYQQLPQVKIAPLPAREEQNLEDRIWYLTGSSGGISIFRLL
jgi:hypothetical protein